ncbi:MAG: SDR family oxidoreductase [Dehalococcoidia bacterium]|nr:SDR family oxidoreductase [Dehalococcoidia bacterium]
MMPRKVLVTGGCGYIGSVLVPILIHRGYEVVVLDKLYFGTASLDAVSEKVHLVPGDVRTIDDSVLDGVWAVIHLGSLSNDPTAEFHPEASESINFQGTVRFAEMCKRRGVERFTFASTCAVYGFWLDSEATETHATSPQSAYARSKLDAENALRMMACDGFCPIVLRQATVFGLSPRMRWDIVLNAFVMHAFRTGKLDVWFGGEAWRPLVHVRDVAEAHVACLEAPQERVAGHVFNLVYDNYVILDLARRVSDALASVDINTTMSVNNDQEDSRSYRVSGSLLKEMVGFVPSVSPEDGAREIGRALKNGHKANFDHPIYYNLPWMNLLVSVEEQIKKTGPVL